jgi:hypothetical protein
MKKYIAELKTRSHAEKSNFAFIASLAITGVVAGLWILTIIVNPNDYIEIRGDDVQNLANAGSLFDVFSQSFESLK